MAEAKELRAAFESWALRELKQDAANWRGHDGCYVYLESEWRAYQAGASQHSTAAEPDAFLYEHKELDVNPILHRRQWSSTGDPADGRKHWNEVPLYRAKPNSDVKASPSAVAGNPVSGVIATKGEEEPACEICKQRPASVGRWCRRCLGAPEVPPSQERALRQVYEAKTISDARQVVVEALAGSILATPSQAAEKGEPDVDLREALERAAEWIGNTPHGDNCYVSEHYEGDPGDRCNCGKESIEGYLNHVLTLAPDTLASQAERPAVPESFRKLMRVIDMHVFEKEGALSINPLFLGQFAEAVQEAREAIAAAAPSGGQSNA